MQYIVGIAEIVLWTANKRLHWPFIAIYST
jgi:hypothetical protein